MEADSTVTPVTCWKALGKAISILFSQLSSLPVLYLTCGVQKAVCNYIHYTLEIVNMITFILFLK
jgi:hypothetical protein